MRSKIWFSKIDNDKLNDDNNESEGRQQLWYIDIRDIDIYTTYVHTNILIIFFPLF